MERRNDRLPIFTERFRQLQGEMSNTEFADSLGISRQTVGFYCNGDRVPDAVTLVKIAEKCKVSADWLLGVSNFPTIVQKRDANDLFDELTELMEIEFDEHDRKRVKQTLIEVINGFKSAATTDLAYASFETAIGHTALALSTVAQCLRLAQKQAETMQGKGYENRDEQNSLLVEIDKIINRAATSSYVDLGHFFKSCRNEIMDILNASDYYGWNIDFTIMFDKLEEKLGK